jgi:hypothetical protein
MRVLASAVVPFAAALGALACAAAPKPAPAPAPVPTASSAQAAPQPPSVPAKVASAPADGSENARTPADGRPCGELGCRAFATPRAAFEYAVRSAPRVLAIGESHAQKNALAVTSATERFRNELLPALAGRAKGIVIELLLPDRRCQKSEVKAVEKRQEVVTKPQAATNQNEFVALGQTARSLGIVPQPLVPTCDELRAVLAAGAGDIDAMLELIANITVRETLALLQAGAPEQAVLTYGGLVHNDKSPRPGRETWSFGPRLAEKAGGSYIELDLIVPEFVRPEPPWTNLPWYPHYDAARDGTETRLFETSPGSFVLVFPRAPNEKVLP